MKVWNDWTRLCRVWNTDEAYQVLNLLREEHIQAKTVPDEFNGPCGNRRLLSMDSEQWWPVYVKARHAKRTIALLRKEGLYPDHIEY